MTPLPSPAEIARELETRHPGWVILWRCWACRYWAFPCWITTGAEVVEARQAGDLLALIEEIECQHQPPGGHRYPPIRRRGELPAA